MLFKSLSIKTGWFALNEDWKWINSHTKSMSKSVFDSWVVFGANLYIFCGQHNVQRQWITWPMHWDTCAQVCTKQRPPITLRGENKTKAKTKASTEKTKSYRHSYVVKIRIDRHLYSQHLFQIRLCRIIRFVSHRSLCVYTYNSAAPFCCHDIYVLFCHLYFLFHFHFHFHCIDMIENHQNPFAAKLTETEICFHVSFKVLNWVIDDGFLVSPSGIRILTHWSIVSNVCKLLGGIRKWMESALYNT